MRVRVCERGSRCIDERATSYVFQRSKKRKDKLMETDLIVTCSRSNVASALTVPAPWAGAFDNALSAAALNIYSVSSPDQRDSIFAIKTVIIDE